MRKPFVAGNWKMNKLAGQAKILVEEMLPGLQSVHAVESVLCPPFLSLMLVSELVANTGIGVGAQNLFWETSGAYTGEVSPEMVREFCDYVILGHSERRAYFGETDQTLNKRVLAALKVGLTPIVCVGETLSENEAGLTADVINRQVVEGLANLTAEQGEKLVVAYEPVWAIGTGRAASGPVANTVLADIIRPTLADLFGDEVAQGIRILYGGSVTSANAAEFFGQPEIDGALVGGASLKPADFVAIVQAAAQTI
ncbi:MAG TPA: triose-phosphate isomerase [Anaerolineaceae bacterium]|nr:triose-phosphate isomerase [Anaerolineaceae bacterium]HOH18855.1 triose-phosphate isomerase [Anaerolineaceae bacterium]HPA33569.1 triose-phosphate isomerase [Anaerolineaceae bacterium]